MPRVTIDNQVVEVTPGSNLLAAARMARIDIPALCYHPSCKPNTTCMACVVKLKDPDRIVPACATPAEDDMLVESETHEIHALRKTALELLLSDHPRSEDNVCTCDQRDLCRLRKYAEMYGADATRYAGQRRGIEAKRYEHPEIAFDPAKCILCGICVELARQGGEPFGLTFIGRGFDVRVDVPLDAKLEAALTKTARLCAGACPTGALTRRK